MASTGTKSRGQSTKIVEVEVMQSGDVAGRDDTESSDADLDFDEAPRPVDDERGVSADLVRAYLNGIGRTKLLTAEQEVDLAKRIEAGLFAERASELADEDEPTIRRSGRPATIMRRGGPPRTTCSRRTCGWWSASPSATPAAAWPSST